MNYKDSEEYRQKVIDSALDWAKGVSPISNQEELVIIADHYNVSVPRYTCNFIKSDNPDTVTATGSYKGLLKLLQRLKQKILRKEGCHDQV